MSEEKPKKRILFSSEASFLNTGFSNILRELLPRLVATGKYEIAEMGSYSTQSDPRVESFIKGRWKFYGVQPMTEEENRAFNDPNNQSPRCGGQNTWQFGEGKFPYVLADFKPDFVAEFRDWWMLEFVERSPFFQEKYFKFIAMPTVDALGQKEEWIDTYRNVNLCLSYSDFGVDTLKRHGGIRIYEKPMRPGVDLETFKPRDKLVLKKEWLETEEDIKVIGCCMRNQSRKLFPDAIDAFTIMKEKYAGEPVVDKSVLVLHSSWPDNMYSYDYPRHLHRIHNHYHGLQYYSKKVRDSVLNSFLCHDCGHVFLSYAASLYGKPVEQRGRGPKIYIHCPKCGKHTATTPDTSTGYNREQLAKLYGMYDLFIQVSNSEGCAMPVQECKSCGTMTLVTDYSAMSEKGRFPSEYIHLKDVKEEDYTVHLGGDIIPVGRYYYEPETSCRRAHPDVHALSDLMYKYLANDALREQKNKEARRCAEDNYDWDKLAKEWEYVFDEVKPYDRSQTWDKPHILVPDSDEVEVPSYLNGEALIDFLYLNILKYDIVDPAGKQHWLQQLKMGGNRENLIQHFKQIRRQEINSKNVINRLLANNEKKNGDEIEGELI